MPLGRRVLREGPLPPVLGDSTPLERAATNIPLSLTEGELRTLSVPQTLERLAALAARDPQGAAGYVYVWLRALEIRARGHRYVRTPFRVFMGFRARRGARLLAQQDRVLRRRLRPVLQQIAVTEEVAEAKNGGRRGDHSNSTYRDPRRAVRRSRALYALRP